DALTDGVVGNCAEAGVLGPVPGILGSLQALVTLKILLKMAGQLAGELLLLDFGNFSSMRIQAARRADCRAPGCALIKGLAAEESGIEVQVESIAAAQAKGFMLVDIRDAEEIATAPSGVHAIPMARVRENPALLPQGKPIALLCASGKRSL